MEFHYRRLAGVFEITLSPHADSRGFFMRAFDDVLFEEAGIRHNWVQENHSRSEQKHIIRGLHFQFPPHAEAKLVRCIRGAVLDVFVDLRLGSETFGQWGSIRLDEDNKKMILIPRGFAHGFCTLTDVSEVLYKVDNYYSKDNEGGLIWNDPDIGIEWPTRTPVLSEKDRSNISLNTFIKTHKGIQL